MLAPVMASRRRQAASTAHSTTHGTDVLYDAGRQAWKVRALTWFAVCVAAGAVWWGVDLARHYGLAPADGGVLAPLATRIAVGCGVASIGVVFFAGMWVYARQYITQVRQVLGTDGLVIRTLGGFTGEREQCYASREVRFGRRHEDGAGMFSGDAPPAHGTDVHAPWQAVRVPDRRLPLVLDAQGWFRPGGL